MEFNPTQQTLINLLLPSKYKIDIFTKTDSRPVILILETIRGGKPRF